MTLVKIQKQIRKDFPILRREIHGQPLAYFDNAATTLKPEVVIEAIDYHYLAETANIHRGVHLLSEKATEKYENSRKIIQEFLNAESANQVIMTSGTTDSINLVANSYGSFLQEGDEIIISHMEHHSNIVPWQMLCEQKGCVLKVVPINDAGEFIFEEYEKLLSPQTKFVSVTYISNALGTINPIKKIIDAAHQFNAPVLIDAAQAASHVAIDVQELDCDFLALSGHKLFGPTGTGVLYGKKELLEKMPPYRGGGDMILTVSFEKTIYAGLPHKFEAGTPNIAGVIGLGAAITYIKTLGFDIIKMIEDDLLNYATEKMSKINGLRIIGTAKEKASVLSFVLENVHPHDIGTMIDQDGIALRTGHHCAQPVMDRFKVPATARASFSIYNTRDEIDRLVESTIKLNEMFS